MIAATSNVVCAAAVSPAPQVMAVPLILNSLPLIASVLVIVPEVKVLVAVAVTPVVLVNRLIAVAAAFAEVAPVPLVREPPT